ncbi:MAG: radical SAM family heme chaperone HemW [Proteobacteria bacterium]|nr:radical SAM family heme chaperone HemW [Pseudomonadota bacterium]
MMTKIGIYIHWPWCESKCNYCDFNSYAVTSYNEKQYVEFMVTELDQVYRGLHESLQNAEVSSVYFGGGTPSLMKPESVNYILKAIKERFDFTKNLEISMECNPASADIQKLDDFRKAGVNRLSIGVQSFDDNVLTVLNRKHTSKQAKQIINDAIAVFDSVSIDLIYGIPDQSLNSWKKDLKMASELGISHLSCYQLTIEPNTVFYRLSQENKFAMPDIDLQGDFFDVTRTFLESHGFANYEVSNFAKAGFECKHNVNIWKYNSYIGLGAGAHSRILNENLMHVARQNELLPKKYMQLLSEGQSVSEDELLNSKSVATEMLLLGLRLKEGFNLDKFKATSGYDIRGIVNSDKFYLLLDEGMLCFDKANLRLTEKSYHLLNEVISELLS